MADLDGDTDKVLERVKREVREDLRLDYLVTGSWSLKGIRAIFALLRNLRREAMLTSTSITRSCQSARATRGRARQCCCRCAKGREIWRHPQGTSLEPDAARSRSCVLL